MNRTLKLASILLLFSFAASPARAQFFGSNGASSGSGGMFGNRTTGTGSGLSSFGSNSGMGSSSSGQGAFGQNGPLQASQNYGIGGQANPQGNGFVGTTAQQVSRNFIGAAQANANGQQGTTGTTVPGLASLPGSMGGLNGGATFGSGIGSLTSRLGQPGSGSAAASPADNAPSIRTQITVAFTSPAAGPAGTVIASHLNSLPGLHSGPGPMTVELQGHTAVLRGVVSSEHDRDFGGTSASAGAHGLGGAKPACCGGLAYCGFGGGAAACPFCHVAGTLYAGSGRRPRRCLVLDKVPASRVPARGWRRCGAGPLSARRRASPSGSEMVAVDMRSRKSWPPGTASCGW